MERTGKGYFSAEYLVIRIRRSRKGMVAASGLISAECTGEDWILMNAASL